MSAFASLMQESQELSLSVCQRVRRLAGLIVGGVCLLSRAACGV